MRRTVAVNQDAYLARPAIPIQWFINYWHYHRKTHAFVGLSAGVVLARGREMQDANRLKDYDDFTIYFHNGLGYTIGGQLGVRHSFGAFDAGCEFGLSFMHLSLTQGTGNAPYNFNLMCLPAKVCVGYSF